MNAIPVGTLPKTLLDGMVRLGIRHVWIDLLSIVQDDKNDWLREASLMHQIYANAAFNVSADWATSNSGMFVERSLAQLQQAQIDLDFNTPARTVEKITFTSVERYLWSLEIDDAPLNSCGWVLQELLLSSRNIHFGRREIFWECREAAGGETLEDARAANRGNSPYDSSASIKAFQPSQSGARDDFDTGLKYASDRRIDGAYEIWAEIVFKYSCCELTFESDKLPSLAGAARYMKGILQDTYVAAIWLRHLPTQLAWCNIPRGPHGDRLVDDKHQCPGTAQYPWSDDPVTNDLFGPLTGTEVELK
ncbi:hypothetical protein QBC44DRAFT_167083 [Cladorrhinum sp. PSN332]|nr:hypothetical protein QBC44DRAFT_167083 [Cladorrhinum sp. PSN332]